MRAVARGLLGLAFVMVNVYLMQPDSNSQGFNGKERNVRPSIVRGLQGINKGILLASAEDLAEHTLANKRAERNIR